jgi:hypothetical protein
MAGGLKENAAAASLTPANWLAARTAKGTN